jgi:hypothetical protein
LQIALRTREPRYRIAEPTSNAKPVCKSYGHTPQSNIGDDMDKWPLPLRATQRWNHAAGCRGDHGSQFRKDPGHCTFHPAFAIAPHRNTKKIDVPGEREESGSEHSVSRTASVASAALQRRSAAQVAASRFSCGIERDCANEADSPSMPKTNDVVCGALR